MPRVLRSAGFVVDILLPPREHGPAHVHVGKAGALVIIDLQPIAVRVVYGMRAFDVVRAVRLVEQHAFYLRAMWRKHHADSASTD